MSESKKHWEKVSQKKCSGLEIKQYNETELQQELSKAFTMVRCVIEDHITPFDTKQNFLFCSFKVKAA